MAINCFYGDCRKHFNLAKYPQIIIQIRDVGSFAYKGPFEFNYMSNYLNLLQKPLVRLDSFNEFMQFYTKTEVILRILILKFKIKLNFFFKKRDLF